MNVDQYLTMKLLPGFEKLSKKSLQYRVEYFNIHNEIVLYESLSIPYVWDENTKAWKKKNLASSVPLGEYLKKETLYKPAKDEYVTKIVVNPKHPENYTSKDLGTGTLGELAKRIRDWRP